MNPSPRRLTIAAALVLGAAAPILAQADSARAADSTAFGFPNPHATRLFFAPTGRMLAKGSGYVSDFYVILPGINVGVTDRFSIGGMVLALSNIVEPIWFVTPKFGLVQRQNINVAAGALMMQLGGTQSGIAYGVSTFGTKDLSLTGGVGYGYSGGRMASRPMLVGGGEARLASDFSIVTENWLLPDGEHAILSAGLRIVGRRVAFDVGGVRVVERGRDDVLPLVGLTVRW